MSKLALWFAIGVLGTCVGGCAATPMSITPEPKPRAGANEPEPPLEERAYYRSFRAVAGKAGYRPQIGVALSGGGSRAASYAIGVLGALEANGILDKVDIVSSVSGGSYANYWLVSQEHWVEKGAERVGELTSKNCRDDETDSCYVRHPDARWAAEEPGDRYYSYFSYCAELRPDARDWASLDELTAWAKPLLPDHCDSTYRKDGVTFEPYRIRGIWQWHDGPSPGVFQHHLENHGYLLNWVQEKAGRLLGSVELGAKGLFHLLTVIPHWVLNGAFDANINLNAFEGFYKRGIERQFGLYPLDRTLHNYANAESFIFPRTSAESPFLGDAALVQRIEKGELPFFVFNATAAYGGRIEPFRNFSWSGFEKDLSKTVYEFTALDRGNQAFGRCGYTLPEDEDAEGADDAKAGCYRTKPIDLGQATAISGAAVDVLGRWDWLLEPLNISLGQHIGNPRVSPGARFRSRLVPFPFYLFGPSYGAEKATIYLSDGGHAENLGVYSLIRRGVRQIVVVDAESEAGSPGDTTLAAFEALQELRCHLDREHGMRINLVGADPANLRAMLSAEPCAISSRETIGYDFQRSDPAFELVVCPQRRTECNDGEGRIRLLYVKLALDPKFVAAVDSNDLTQCDRSDSLRSCASMLFFADDSDREFPHHSTFDLFYTKRQFAAYRNLGRFNGNRVRLESPDSYTLVLTSPEQAIAPKDADLQQAPQ